MIHRRVFLFAFMTALAVTAAAEAGTPKKAATQPAGGKAIKRAVKQPAQFAALARKAAALKGVYVKGYMQRGSGNVPADRKEMKFETWTTPRSPGAE
jgi:hypothetical protein